MQYSLTSALTEWDNDQVRTQTMYEIKFKSGFKQIDDTFSRMNVYGQNFTLPDRTVTFEDLQFRAYKIPVPTTFEQGQDHSITVWADVRGDLRRACLDWQAACINPDIGGGSLFQANRRPTMMGAANEEPLIIVDLLAPDYETVVESTKIHGARITKVAGLELSNTAGGINTFGVDFKSVWWEQVAGNGGPRDGDANRNTKGLGGMSGQQETQLATTDVTDGNVL